MKKIFLIIKGIMTLIGFAVVLFSFVFFFNDPDIKLKHAIALAKQITGFGHDYSAFTAQSINDYFEVFKRGIAYRMGMDRDKYPSINLSLDMTAVSSLDRQRRNQNEKRFWIKGKLIQQNEDKVENIYNIKLRTKGDRKIHNNDFDQMSFKIDIRGKKRLQGLEEFSVQHPMVRNYGWEMLINSVAQKENLLAPDYNPINFFFNGVSRGIYIIEEGFGVEFLERRGRKEGPIFSIDEPLGQIFPNIYYEPYEASKINKKNQHVYNMAYTKLNDFKQNYQQKNVSKYFDLPIWAKFFAIIDTFGSYHGAVTKSVKLYFNPTTQLFEPIMFDNHLGGRGYLSFSLLDFYSGIETKNCGFVCSDRDWFESFFKNKSFITEYIKALSETLEKLSKGFYLENINEVEKFNNSMYASLMAADRVFFAAPLLYYFDITHLDQRSKLLRAKITQLAGYNFSSETNNNFYKDFLYFQKALKDRCKLHNHKDCKIRNFKFIQNLEVINKDIKLSDKTIYILNGKTILNNSSIFSKGNETMLVQLGGEFIAKNTVFNNFSNIFIPGTNWTGAINLLKTKANLENVIFQNSKGEDAINLVNSSLISNGTLRFKAIDQDAFDSDNSSFIFEKIQCTDVGNDCLDTSYSIVKGKSVTGSNIGDKLISIGEKSSASLQIVECIKCGIGVAVKDLSNTSIDTVSFSETPLYLSIFQKKEIFGPAKLYINFSDHDYKDVINKSMIGNNSFLKFGTFTKTGGKSSEAIKNSLYGNEYGKASVRH